jgi:hypothetical protein
VNQGFERQRKNHFFFGLVYNKSFPAYSELRPLSLFQVARCSPELDPFFHFAISTLSAKQNYLTLIALAPKR